MGQRRQIADDPAAEDFLRLLAKVAPVGIVQTDAGGQCVFANDRWCELTGIMPAQALGAGWSDALHPADVQRVTEEWEQAARSGAELSTDCRLRPPSGGEVWVHVTAVPLHGAGGDRAGYLAAITNISDRKRAEAERERLLAAEQRARTSELAARELAELAQQRLVEQNARLMELDEERRQFLATASHELSTPITAIISFCDLIRDTDAGLGPQTLDSLGVIQRSARRLLRLVGDLLLLTRVEAGGMPLDLAPVSVPDLVADAVRDAAPEAAKQGVQIEVAIEDGPPLLGDQVRLQQVLDNLVSNAVKFSAAGRRDDGGAGLAGHGQAGPVRVSATHDDAAWQVEVSDSGIGIPAGELGLVFSRFARASNARSAGLPGTGLGLPVVRAITDLHGGRVDVESAEGRGTTFRVHLPIPR
jgi:PAS domain S-box-containing protein